ncbi:MAG: hypothetical protein COB38_09940 [Gammaproteobacteria bacterium]|nr:MAG: hypothetical protein COB38_09940 [Gammaproteobacteria bacterium]
MKNKTFLLIAGLVLINSQDCSSKQSYADIKANLLACKDIESNTDRLDCFDRVVVSQNDTSRSAITGDKVKLAEESSIILLTQTPTKTESADKIRERKQSNSSPIASNFGMEFADQDAKVESFLVAEFTSWKKGMKLKLKNGQIWKVINARSGYRRMTNPSITISRGFFGSFDAKIEGLNAKVKVKRIK